MNTQNRCDTLEMKSQMRLQNAARESSQTGCVVTKSQLPKKIRRIAIVTDAWYPQVNGVVRTLATVVESLEDKGYVTRIIHPGVFTTLPLPGYGEIRLSLFPSRRVARILKDFHPDAIHIATEGTLGLAARRYCLLNELQFTTAYHTKFPEYLHVRTKLPLKVGYGIMRNFHNKAAAVLVATESLKTELMQHHFQNLTLWSRGVDTELFRPVPFRKRPASGPIMLYVGRVAPEKNIAAFLKLDLPGTKIVVGDGPSRKHLMRQFPDVVFAGYQSGRELATFYARADVMVFPSLTDTFGLVLLEANACGTPVAAFPVTGPRDVILPGFNGDLNWDLGRAIEGALRVDRNSCRSIALGYSWEVCAQKFADSLVPVR